MPFRDPRSIGIGISALIYTSRAVRYRPGMSEPLPEALAVAGAVQAGVYAAIWAICAAMLFVVALRKIPTAPWQIIALAPPVIWGFLYVFSGREDGVLAAPFMWGFAGIVACFLYEPVKARVVKVKPEVVTPPREGG